MIDIDVDALERKVDDCPSDLAWGVIPELLAALHQQQEALKEKDDSIKHIRGTLRTCERDYVARLEQKETEIARLREAIEKHKASFTEIADATTEDWMLWSSLESTKGSE